MGTLWLPTEQFRLALRVVGGNGALLVYGEKRGEGAYCYVCRELCRGVTVLYSLSVSELVCRGRRRRQPNDEWRVYLPVDSLLRFLRHGDHGVTVGLSSYYGNGVRLTGGYGEFLCRYPAGGVDLGGECGCAGRGEFPWYVEFPLGVFVSNLGAVLSARYRGEESSGSTWRTTVRADLTVREVVESGVHRVWGELRLVCGDGYHLAMSESKGECYGSSNSALDGAKAVTQFWGRDGVLALLDVLVTMHRHSGGDLLSVALSVDRDVAVFRCGGAAVVFDKSLLLPSSVSYFPDFRKELSALSEGEVSQVVRVNAGVLRGLVCAIVPDGVGPKENGCRVRVGLLPSKKLTFYGSQNVGCNGQIKMELGAEVIGEVEDGFCVSDVDLVPMREFLENVNPRQALSVYLQDVLEGNVGLVLSGEGVRYMGLARKGW